MHITKKDTWYILEVEGDSMVPDYIQGDLILLDSAREPVPGDIVAAWVSGPDIPVNMQGGTLKVYKPQGEIINLVPINIDHQIQIYRRDQVQIQGVVIELVRSRRTNGLLPAR